jgi:hypothetical protein
LAHFGFQIPEEMAAAFDQYAAPRGGRSAALRTLVEQVLNVDADAEEPVAATRTEGHGMVVRLSNDDLARLDEECRAIGMTRRQWLTSCIRNRLHGTRHFGQVDRERIARSVKELREIKTSLFRYAGALERSPRDLALIEKHYSLVTHLQAEIARSLRAIEGAFKGNDGYWRGVEAAPTGERLTTFSEGPPKNAGLDPTSSSPRATGAA